MSVDSSRSSRFRFTRYKRALERNAVYVRLDSRDGDIASRGESISHCGISRCVAQEECKQRYRRRKGSKTVAWSVAWFRVTPGNKRFGHTLLDVVRLLADRGFTKDVYHGKTSKVFHNAVGRKGSNRSVYWREEYDRACKEKRISNCVQYVLGNLGVDPTGNATMAEMFAYLYPGCKLCRIDDYWHDKLERFNSQENRLGRYIEDMQWTGPIEQASYWASCLGRLLAWREMLRQAKIEGKEREQRRLADKAAGTYLTTIKQPFVGVHDYTDGLGKGKGLTPNIPRYSSWFAFGLAHWNCASPPVIPTR